MQQKVLWLNGFVDSGEAEIKPLQAPLMKRVPKMTPDDEGDVHNSLIFLIDKEGRALLRFEGVETGLNIRQILHCRGIKDQDSVGTSGHLAGLLSGTRFVLDITDNLAEPERFKLYSCEEGAFLAMVLAAQYTEPKKRATGSGLNVIQSDRGATVLPDGPSVGGKQGPVRLIG